MSIREKLIHLVVCLLLIMIVGYGLLTTDRQSVQFRREKRAKLVNQIKRLEMKVEDLEALSSEKLTPSDIERIAREELNMVRADELMIVIAEEDW